MSKNTIKFQDFEVNTLKQYYSNNINNVNNMFFNHSSYYKNYLNSLDFVYLEKEWLFNKMLYSFLSNKTNIINSNINNHVNQFGKSIENTMYEKSISFLKNQFTLLSKNVKNIYKQHRELLKTISNIEKDNGLLNSLIPEDLVSKLNNTYSTLTQEDLIKETYYYGFKNAYIYQKIISNIEVLKYCIFIDRLLLKSDSIEKFQLNYLKQNINNFTLQERISYYSNSFLLSINLEDEEKTYIKENNDTPLKDVTIQHTQDKDIVTIKLCDKTNPKYIKVLTDLLNKKIDSSKYGSHKCSVEGDNSLSVEVDILNNKYYDLLKDIKAIFKDFLNIKTVIVDPKAFKNPHEGIAYFNGATELVRLYLDK